MSRKQFSEFIPVTELNRKNAIVQGRIIYVISEMGKVITYRGFKVIDPCFDKGRWRIDHLPFAKNVPGKAFETYIFTGVDRNDWAKDWKAIIDKGIKEKELFIKPSDPIIQYFKI